MNGQMSTAAFIKSAFYKTCFCIGLGTASYYSYGQVQNWVSAPPSAVAQSNSPIQQKVDTLMSASSEPNSVAVTANGAATDSTEQALGFRANTKLYLIPNKKAAAPVAAPVVLAGDSSATPAATPGAAAALVPDAAKEGEAKDGEKKEGEVAKTEEGAILAPAATGPVNALGLPFAPAANEQVAAQAPAQSAGQSAGQPSAASAAATSPSLGPIGSGSVAGTSGAGANSGSSAPETPSYGNTASGTTTNTTTGVASATPAATPSSTNGLSAIDVTQLTGTVIKASFTDQTETVSGLVCAIGMDSATATDCVKNNRYTVHSDRWNTTYGLSSDATFSIASTTGASEIMVNVSLKLQDLNQNFQTLTVSVAPTEVLTQLENKNGKTYKVYQLKLPDMAGLKGEKMTSVLATLVYEESATGTGAMSADSALTFSRGRVETTASTWDLTGLNRAPAANDQVVVADLINYTMNLEKSP